MHPNIAEFVMMTIFVQGLPFQVRCEAGSQGQDHMQEDFVWQHLATDVLVGEDVR